MCGIAGVRRFGDNPITQDEITILLCSLERRGNHATGIAIVDREGTGITVHKMPVPAWSFVRDNATEAFFREHLLEDTSMVLLHTRAATVGSPADNRNNHPMWAGTTAVVHNGGIRNADHLFSSLGLKRSCDTDSDILRAILDKEGFTEKAVRELSKAAGSAAIAAASVNHPGILMLARSGNPLVTAAANDKLYWASEVRALHKAVRPWERKFGLWMRPRHIEVLYNTLSDDTAYFIQPDGQESSHHEMRILTGQFYAPQYRVHETYASKQLTWAGTNKNKDRVFTRCRKCGTVQSKASYSEWSRLECTKCKEGFAYLDQKESTVA